MSYGDLLRRTEWYNKRDAIKKRDDNKCIYCDCEDLLEVHHLYYYYEKTEPWNYPDDALITVCWQCHELIHEIDGIIKVHKPKLTYDVSDL